MRFRYTEHAIEQYASRMRVALNRDECLQAIEEAVSQGVVKCARSLKDQEWHLNSLPLSLVVKEGDVVVTIIKKRCRCVEPAIPYCGSLLERVESFTSTPAAVRSKGYPVPRRLKRDLIRAVREGRTECVERLSTKRTVHKLRLLDKEYVFEYHNKGSIVLHMLSETDVV